MWPNHCAALMPIAPLPARAAINTITEECAIIRYSISIPAKYSILQYKRHQISIYRNSLILESYVIVINILHA